MIDIDLSKRPSLALETEDWALSCYLEWRAKSHEETCPTCHGTGEVGGGFGSFDGPEQCDRCCGTRTVTVGPKSPRPSLPPELIEYMRRAWWDYFNRAGAQ